MIGVEEEKEIDDRYMTHNLPVTPIIPSETQSSTKTVEEIPILSNPVCRLVSFFEV